MINRGIEQGNQRLCDVAGDFASFFLGQILCYCGRSRALSPWFPPHSSTFSTVFHT
jgi:hypothetical protein